MYLYQIQVTLNPIRLNGMLPGLTMALDTSLQARLKGLLVEKPELETTLKLGSFRTKEKLTEEQRLELCDPQKMSMLSHSPGLIRIEITLIGMQEDPKANIPMLMDIPDTE